MLILTALLCVLLTGCCLSHEWQEASCTAPKTCAKCGKTEGEALGHTWQEATCTAAKTCTVCAATEGEALGHKNLTEANYQQAARCGVCGEEVGEPLTPAFIEHHVLGRYVEFGEWGYYKTACYKDPSTKTFGKLTITNYETFAYDDTHPLKEGYEWKIVDAKIEFSDNAAQNFGMSIKLCLEDYYDIIGHDKSTAVVEEREDGGKVSFTANWNGADYPECLEYFSNYNTGWQNHVWTWYGHYEFLIPEGYDGIVIGFYDAETEWEEGMYIFDVADHDTRFFRLD